MKIAQTFNRLFPLKKHMQKHVKNPAFWVIAFYCVKGTAVTAAMIFAAFFVAQ